MTFDLKLDEVRDLYVYDKLRGTIHLPDETGKAKSVALGSKRGTSGTRAIRLHGKWFRVASIIWLFETGEWVGSKHFEYKDGNPSNTRFSNLILRTESDRPRSAPSKPYRARIKENGKTRHLGYFETYEAARAAEAATCVASPVTPLPDWLQASSPVSQPEPVAPLPSFDEQLERLTTTMHTLAKHFSLMEMSAAYKKQIAIFEQNNPHVCSDDLRVELLASIENDERFTPDLLTKVHRCMNYNDD